MATVVFHPPSGAKVPAQTFGDKLAHLTGAVRFSSSYTTGGESVDLSPWLRDVTFLMAHPAGGYLFEYDYAKKKLKALKANESGTLEEVAAGTDLSAVTTRFLAVGY